MILGIVLIVLSFAWLLYETDFLRIRLHSTECQKNKALQSNPSGIETDLNSTVSMGYKPVEFIPLDMPDLTGNLNIICKRC